MLVLFFVSSKATKYKGEIKNKFEEDYEKSSQRNWVQIVCNLGVAAQLAVFGLIESNGPGELPLDFQKSFTNSCLIVGVLGKELIDLKNLILKDLLLITFFQSLIGALSCCLGDTLASELGTVLSKKDPFLITTFKRVPRGTNGMFYYDQYIYHPKRLNQSYLSFYLLYLGGISLAGLVVSGLGGFIIGVCYLASLYLFLNDEKVEIVYPQWPILLITFLSGLYGSLLDSMLGAICQFSGRNKKTGKIVSLPGQNVEKISGFNFLDNHTVNLLSTMITPLFSVMFSVYLYQYLIVTN